MSAHNSSLSSSSEWKVFASDDAMGYGSIVHVTTSFYSKCSTFTCIHNTRRTLCGGGWMTFDGNGIRFNQIYTRIIQHTFPPHLHLSPSPSIPLRLPHCLSFPPCRRPGWMLSTANDPTVYTWYRYRDRHTFYALVIIWHFGAWIAMKRAKRPNGMERTNLRANAAAPWIRLPLYLASINDNQREYCVMCG